MKESGSEPDLNEYSAPWKTSPPESPNISGNEDVEPTAPDLILDRKREQADEVADETASKKPKSELPRKECITCGEEVPIDQFPEIPHQAAYNHGGSVCSQCWERYLCSEIESKDWESVCCPECDQRLQESDIRKLANSETYNLWLDKAAKAYQESVEEFIPCPSAACNWGCFFSTKEDGNIFTCRMCKYRYCVICKVPMHENLTCDEYQQRGQRKEEQARDNKASEERVSVISKPCPNCTARLEKYAGCDHVTCRRCQHEFCWVCFAPYASAGGVRGRRGNLAHAQTCSYHPNRLPNLPPDQAENL